jgi:hypothetical protein
LDPGGDVLEQATRAAWAPVREGRFALEGLPAGRWSLYLVSLVDLVAERVAPVMVVEVAGSERRRVVLER